MSTQKYLLDLSSLSNEALTAEIRTLQLMLDEHLSEQKRRQQRAIENEMVDLQVALQKQNQKVKELASRLRELDPSISSVATPLESRERPFLYNSDLARELRARVSADPVQFANGKINIRQSCMKHGVDKKFFWRVKAL